MTRGRPFTLHRPVAICLLLVTAVSCAGDSPPVSGRVVDYRSDAPIENATVTLTQRGWGRSGRQIVWDKAYITTTRTDVDGSFGLSFPAPRILAGRSGSLTVEATGWQRLVDVTVSGQADLKLQTLPVPDATVPGGIAQIGILEDGRHFGWSFADNTPVLDPQGADIFPIRLTEDPYSITLGAPRDGGLLFISREEQGISSPSYGDLLRYMNEAPPGEYRDSLELRSVAGTVVVRTSYGSYAKLAFDPWRRMLGRGRVTGLNEPVRFAVMLPFAYNPRPGRELPFDPTGSTRPMDARRQRP